MLTAKARGANCVENSFFPHFYYSVFIRCGDGEVLSRDSHQQFMLVSTRYLRTLSGNQKDAFMLTRLVDIHSEEGVVKTKLKLVCFEQ